MAKVGGSLYESINLAVAEGIVFEAFVLRFYVFLLFFRTAFKPVTLTAYLINSVKHLLRPPNYSRRYT